MIFPDLKPPTSVDGNVAITDNTSLDFDEYRELCDQYSGLMRIGIEDEVTYNDLLIKKSGNLALNGFLSAVSNNDLGTIIDTNIINGDKMVSILPRPVYESLKQPQEVASYGQCFLSDELTTHILTSPDGTTTQRITDELNGNVAVGERLVRGDGVPEYVLFNKFDTTGEDCDYFKNNAPQDIITANGHIVTASRDKIMSKLPELIQLHESVFNGQTLQVGYYGGLDADGLEAIINNPEFTPIMGFDEATGEVLTFSLFAGDFKDFSALPWLNPRGITKILDSDNTKHNFALALVVTTKANGLGLFNPTVQLAGHTILYEHKPETIYIAYESNGLSILYTPKVIHRNVTNKLGYAHIGTVAEATYITESDI